MKKTILALSIALLASFASAQDVTLTTPVTRPTATKYVVKKFTISATQCLVEGNVQDAAGVEDIQAVNYSIPDAAHPSATVLGCITALMTVRATETGNDLRKGRFRITGYFFDQGIFGSAVNAINP